MKKLRILLIVPLLMALMMNAASANGWGLPGGLAGIASETNDYDDYSDLTDDYNRKYDTARVIMKSRYHNQLIAAEKGADGWEQCHLVNPPTSYAGRRIA